MQRVDDFEVREGGVRALIRGEEVCVGSSGFMHLCGVRLPPKHNAKNAVFAAVGGSLVGIFSVQYKALHSVQDALVTLLHGRRSPIFAIRDFNVDPCSSGRSSSFPPTIFFSLLCRTIPDFRIRP
jgi:hypothetical protein